MTGAPPIRTSVSRSVDVLSAVGGLEAAAAMLLSAEEMARFNRLRREVDREDLVAARVLVRQLALGADDGDAYTLSRLARIRLEQRCATCGEVGHGRPMLMDDSGRGVSWAHTNVVRGQADPSLGGGHGHDVGDGIVAAAVAPHPVGIDVEGVGPTPPPLVPGTGLDAWLTWARIEAVTKLGVAPLDTVLGWAPHLSGPQRQHPQQVQLPDAHVTIQDAYDPTLGVVVALAW